MTKASHFRFMKSPLALGKLCRIKCRRKILMLEAMGIALNYFPSQLLWVQGKNEKSSPYFCDIKKIKCIGLEGLL